MSQQHEKLVAELAELSVDGRYAIQLGEDAKKTIEAILATIHTAIAGVRPEKVDIPEAWRVLRPEAVDIREAHNAALDADTAALDGLLKGEKE